MKNLSKLLSLMLLLSGILLSPVMSHAKLQSPPSGLTEIFEEFSDFESAFKAGKWDDAKRGLNKIDGTFKKFYPQIEREVDGNIVDAYSALSG